MIKAEDVRIGLKFRLKYYDMYVNEVYAKDRDGKVVTFTLTGFFTSSKGGRYVSTDFKGKDGHYLGFPIDVFSREKIDENKSELMAVPVDEKGGEE